MLEYKYKCEKAVTICGTLLAALVAPKFQIHIAIHYLPEAEPSMTKEISHVAQHSSALTDK